MQKSKIKILASVLLFVVVSLIFHFDFSTLNFDVYAQDGGAGVATYIPIAESLEDGTVICSFEGNTNKACEREYDPNTIGVIVTTPAVSFVSENTAGTLPILSFGKAYVLVSTKNGNIDVGDYVTSSRTKGVAQKATKSGYILGSALEKYEESDKEKVGKILVSLSVKPAVLKKNAEANLLQMIKDGVEGAFESPLSALRYVVSALIVSVIFIFGFIHFGRIAKSGVDAIGRNPLASRSIQTGVVMNMGITIAIMAASVFVAYLILVI